MGLQEESNMWAQLVAASRWTCKPVKECLAWGCPAGRWHKEHSSRACCCLQTGLLDWDCFAGTDGVGIACGNRQICWCLYGGEGGCWWQGQATKVALVRSIVVSDPSPQEELKGSYVPLQIVALPGVTCRTCAGRCENCNRLLRERGCSEPTLLKSRCELNL